MNHVVYVTPVDYKGKDEVEGPTPSRAGLSKEKAYIVVDIHDESDNWDSEAYVSVINSQGEVWFVSNRHLRVSHVYSSDGNKLLWKNETYSIKNPL